MQIISRAEAKAAALKWYFTGEPCKNGHVSERNTKNGSCLACARATAKRKYDRDPEKFKALSRARREAEPEKVLSATKKWRDKNKDHIKAYSAEWRANHPEWYVQHLARADVWAAILENSRKRRRQNPDRFNRHTRAWRKRNPDAVRAGGATYRARKKGAEGRYTKGDIERLRVSQRNRCASCRKPLRGLFHVDHIVALAAGGSNWPDNLQLLCPTCNCSKGAKDPFDWARENGRLL